MCDVFDVPKVRRFVQLMKDFDLRELELRQGDMCISLKRGAGVESVPPAAMIPATTAAPAQNTTAEVPAAVAEEPAYLETISSPVVGTFYSRPNPNAAPFAGVGDMVKAEKTICIIEAMKVMNQIPAGISGKITAVLVKDGDAVEFGQPLFKVDTRG